jgi:hypothetical protein
MSDDIINGPIIGTDAGGIGFNRTKQFIDSGKDTPGADLKSLYQQIVTLLGNKPSLLEEDFKSRNDRIYFGWLYDQYSSDIKNYLREFFSALEYPEEESPEPEIVPNNGEEEIPVYIVRSSVPGGLRGRIYFEFRKLDNQIELGGIGELDQDSYNTEEIVFSSVGESSTDFNYRGIGDSILQQLNNQIQELDGVEEFGVLSIVETQTEPPQNFYDYTITGKVVDGLSKEPLEDVYITDDVKSVGLVGSNINSEPTGDFKLDGEYLKEKTFKITFSLDGYITKTINPFTKKGNLNILPSSIGIIELYSTIPNKQVTIEETPFTELQVQTITTAEKLKDPQGFFTSELLQRTIKTVKTTLLPFALVQIARFGITNPKEALGKKIEDLNVSCPANLEDLNQIIANKNKLTKQLNNIFKSLETIKIGVEFAGKIITIADVVFQTLSTVILTFPSIPFAPDITKAFTAKIPQLGNKSVQEVITITLETLKITSAAILLILNILIQIIQLVLNYLSLLDGLIQKCAIDGALPQESLSEDLLLATQGQAEQGSPVVTNVNGFKMGLLSVEGATDEGLKRKRAIARNRDGVIMLQGEPSFSSNDQILIDELVFYIKQNNLKAD